MPCAVPARGKTDLKMPWNDVVTNDPCGNPIVPVIAGVDVSAQNLCLFHYAQKYGQAAIPKGLQGGDDAYTVLLLHGEELKDVHGHPLTALGDAKADPAQFKYGSAALAFDGTGDYITSPDSPDWGFGAGDFTIDCWVRFWAVSQSGTFAAQWSATPGNQSWNFTVILPAGQLRFDYSRDGTTTQAALTVPWAPVINQWYHVAVVRSGTGLMFFVDGVQVGTTQNITNHVLYDANEPLLIGGRASGANYMPAHIDEFRISKGIARWTANFTPPAAPYT